MEIKLSPIAYVQNSRKEITDDYWGGIVSEIMLTEDFDERALKGISEFSHLEIIYYFNKVEQGKIETGARIRGIIPIGLKQVYLPKEVRTVQISLGYH
jgi:tRNA (adenine37-N6)-methyltransferase